jgi:chemotaxis protein CheX
LPKPLSEQLFVEYLKSILPENKVANESFKMDVNFINPFIIATLEVLKITANTQATKEKVYVKPTDTASGDISALVSMNSEQFHGSFAVCFEKACYLEVMSNMMMENYSEIVGEIKDGVGEICNQIFGLTKARMNAESGILIDKAIPTIISGNKHTISHMLVGKCLVVKFNTSRGSFTIEAIVKAKD